MSQGTAAALRARRVYGVREIEARIDERPIQIEDDQSHELRRVSPANGAADRALSQRAYGWFAARSLPVNFVFDHFPQQSIAMDPEQFARLGLISVRAAQGPLDHASLQNLDGLLQEEPGLDEVVDQSVEAFFHLLDESLFSARVRAYSFKSAFSSE